VLRDGVAVHATARAVHAGPFATGGHHGHHLTGAPQAVLVPPQASAPAQALAQAPAANEGGPDTQASDALFAELGHPQREEA
jgi:hypothetical protein